MTAIQPAKRKTKPPLPAALRARIERIQTQMLDVAERILTQLAAPPESASLPAERRQLANTLGLWRFCGRQMCSRSRCCRGEPKACLQAAAPLLPAETLARLLGGKKDRRRRAPAMPALVAGIHDLPKHDSGRRERPGH